MARIAPVTERDSLPEDKRPIYDSIAASRGRVGPPFSYLLNSPEVAGRVAHLGAYLRFESLLPPVEREIATLVAAWESKCDLEWAGHKRLGRQAGVREETIEAIAGEGFAGLPEDEVLIVRYGRELLRTHRVSESTFEAARARFGNQGVLELTAIFGYYAMLASMLNALEVEPPAQ